MSDLFIYLFITRRINERIKTGTVSTCGLLGYDTVYCVVCGYQRLEKTLLAS